MQSKGMAYSAGKNICASSELRSIQHFSSEKELTDCERIRDFNEEGDRVEFSDILFSCGMMR